MAKEWVIECKSCGEEFGYSDRSFRNSLQYGFSRPEYCEKCQEIQVKMRRGVGAPYFHVPRIKGLLVPGYLGFIPREERIHVPVEREGAFDSSKFGLTVEKIGEIAEWFKNPNHRVVVVVGPTGSGKSTALPYWLLYPPEELGLEEDFFTRDGQILVTQPRIVAVKGISNYLGSDLIGSSVGKGFDVGFSYSKEDKSDWRNAIDLTTDGKFVHALIAGRVSQFGIIIVDEAHERSERIETILRLLKDRMKLYPNLKLIVASATINQEFFREYFEQEGAKVVEFEGKARLDKDGNPVKPPDPQFATEDEKLPYEDLKKLVKPLRWAVKNKAQWIIEEVVSGRKDWGDILIFLQGKAPIDNLVEDLKSWVRKNEDLAGKVEVYPLYRDVDDETKEKVLDVEASMDVLRVIVSTNIAEASVTVDGVIYEIETGVEYQPKFNPETNSTEVPLVLISKANAKQRWGRTGRTRSGEVFCLYTEQQYNDNELFLKYPIPDMQRMSMEDVVLTAKAAGIPNVAEGWLEDPPGVEIKRSVNELVDVGALDEDGSLTSYGAMIRWFSYPKNLIDTLLSADDIGCAVEFATLLPVIKNGGKRRLLRWDGRWDAYTKRQAYKRHQALMSGCQDDVEFILKLFKSWNELPWLYHFDLAKLDKDELEEIRKQWCKLHYLNHRVMKEIQEESDETLESLRSSVRSDKARDINLNQIRRLRDLMLSVFSDVECLTPPEEYEFKHDLEPQEGSAITCYVLKDDHQVYDPDNWLTPKTWKTKAEEHIFSRLLVDQVYPVGFRYEAEVDEAGKDHVLVKIGKNLTRAGELDRERKVEVVDDDYDAGEDFEEELEEDVSTEESKVSIFDFQVFHRQVKCSHSAVPAKVKKGQQVVVQVSGYECSVGLEPVVQVEIVPQPEPFEVFAKKHRYGDEVKVEVKEILQFPNDYGAYLVVEEGETGVEVLVEPQDVTFSTNSFSVTEIPVGTKLTLNVERIDKDKDYIRLTNWEAVEEVLNQHLPESEGQDGSARVQAEVATIRDDGKIVFSLSWGNPSSGVSLLTSLFGNKLSKDYTEYELEEKEQLLVSRRLKKDPFVDLDKLPKKARSQIGRDRREEELYWRRGTLYYSGRPNYARLYELKTIDESTTFHQALEALYWFSNRIKPEKIIDSVWDEVVEEKYDVGVDLSGVVLETNASGVVIELETGVTGFLPKSKILGGRFRDHEPLFPEGSTVTVVVSEQKMDEQDLILEVTDEAIDPFNKLEVDQIIHGTINGLADFGIFVDVAHEVSGLAHVSEMYINRSRKPEEFYEVGDDVRVKIVSKDQDKREVSLSMKFPEDDPFDKLEEGQSITGRVTNLADFGAFIELDPTLDRDGLLHTSEYPKTDEAREKIKVGNYLRVRIKEGGIDKEERNVSLEHIRSA